MLLTIHLSQIIFGSTKKMHRLMAYWAATALLYGLCCFIVWREFTNGHLGRPQALLVGWLCVLGVAAFYTALRLAPLFKIPIWKLALAQAVFAIVMDLALYAALTNLGGALLIGMPVVIAFCAFALRPRQTIMLSAFALCALGTTIGTLVYWDSLRHPLFEGSIHFLLAAVGVVSITAITSELNRKSVV